MFTIKNKQISQLKIHAEKNYLKTLIDKMKKEYNSDNKIENRLFENRILMNYKTARFYGFETKREVARFIDFTFIYSGLNKPAPLDSTIHSKLISRNSSPIIKLGILKEHFSSNDLVKD